ncbi:methyltransferase domain-containing protein [bacterium]|nr:methyltransferase domain-containing protein [bacterium]
MPAHDRDIIDHFRDALARRFGLAFDDGKRTFLADVLTRRVGRGGEPAARAYVERLSAGRIRGEEAAELVRECTVGETYFFRHPDQYRALADAVLVGRERPRLRILSAGCASGEEAYSLAVLVREHVSDGSNGDARVVGIDLNPDALAKAALGRYTPWSLRGVPDDLRQRVFRVSGKEHQIDASVRALVSFEERNLLDDAPDFWYPGAFDAIFCRNVLMYFTPEATRAVVDRFARALAPGGLLFLGPAETLRGVSNDFHLCHAGDTFYYQLRPAGETAAVSAAPVTAVADESWVSAIGRASDRIARLSRGARAADAPGPVAPPRPGGGTAPRDPAPPGLPAAREMVRQERYADALAVLGSLADAERDDPDAKLLRAVSLTNCGQVGAAERLCHEVLAGDELNPEARYLLALCLEHAGNLGGAMEQDQAAVYLDPQFAMPHLHLGLLRKREGDRAGARRAFERALALMPREDAPRVLLFGGGFTRETLLRLCEAELRATGTPQ